MSTALSNFSNDLSAAVERASASVVTVHGRPRFPSSGVIWRPGFVLTADATLRRDEDLKVTLPDGRTVPATLRGRDPASDLALLACDTGSSVSTDFKSEQLKPGQIVLTVGRTNDTGPIATMGAISGVSGEWRTWRGGKLDQFVRLDVATYPTTAGGAISDTEGNVIGIVSAGLSRTSVIAITRPTIDRVAEALLSKGHLRRGYLGVGFQPVAIPAKLKQLLNIGQDSGIMALNVQENSPAATAGVLIGDVLLSLDDHATISVEVVHAILDPSSVGRQVTLRILRGGALEQLTATVSDRPQEGA